jgi:hypothetical protein
MLCLKAAAIHTPSRLHRLCIQSMNHCIWWMANLTLPRLYINWKMKWHELIVSLSHRTSPALICIVEKFNLIILLLAILLVKC